MCDLKSGSRACAESMPGMVVCRLIACDSVRMRRDHEMRSACGRSNVVRTKGAGMMFIFCREAFSCMLNRVDGRRFRRRAVLTNRDGQWELVCCTVEELLFGERAAEVAASKYYRKAVLYEDFLTEAECLSFVEALQAGRAQFGNIDLQRGQNPQWSTEHLPVINDYTARAGHAICLRFPQRGNRVSVGPLLEADQPYYPNVENAAHDWLPLRVYHGNSDARNDQLILHRSTMLALCAESTMRARCPSMRSVCEGSICGWRLRYVRRF